MTIYNLKDKLEYLDEVARLEYEEWADNKINIGVRIDIWTHFMRGCIIDYVH